MGSIAMIFEQCRLKCQVAMFCNAVNHMGAWIDMSRVELGSQDESGVDLDRLATLYKER